MFIKNFKSSIVFPALGLCLLISCVPMRKFEETRDKAKRCEEDLSELKSNFMDMETRFNENSAALEDVRKRAAVLQSDTAVLGSSLRQMTTNYDKLNQTYELLLQKNRELLTGNAAETQRLSGQLQSTQVELQRREDDLRQRDLELREKQKNLETLQGELKQREQRLTELENILANKDKAVNDLRKKVADALLGFENNGLTIQVKNGKVYVSLDEKLLFASGSTKVDPKGVEALKKLAKVLESNPDINVLVEGHTDNVPLAGSGAIKDNWDLSVLRATSIVKILTENSKMDPARLTAAGRSEYVPVENENTREARQRNRRTEIILTPKLDELFQILEVN